MAQGQCRIRASLAVAVRATNGRENVLVSAHGCVAAQFVPAHRLSHESRSRDIVAPPRSAFRHLSPGAGCRNTAPAFVHRCAVSVRAADPPVRHRGRPARSPDRGSAEAGVSLSAVVPRRTEEHTSEIPSLMRHTYAFFYLQT